jgi:hypothetical protein
MTFTSLYSISVGELNRGKLLLIQLDLRMAHRKDEPLTFFLPTTGLFKRWVRMRRIFMVRKFSKPLALLLTLACLQACESPERMIAAQLLSIRQAHEEWLRESAEQYLELRKQNPDDAAAFADRVRAIDEHLRHLEMQAASLFLSYVRTKQESQKAELTALIGQMTAIILSFKRGS